MKRLLFSFIIISLIAPGLVSAADAPTISEVSPLTAVVNVPTTFYATASDPDGVASCNMIISSKNKGAMTYDSVNDRWSFTWTFDEIRTANSIRAKCEDGLGNAVNGPVKVMSVLEIDLTTTDGDPAPIENTESEIDATTWSESELVASSPVLIKTVCPGEEDATHPCRTVYFLDNEGNRHAFPNEKAYFTWYENFDGIHKISDENMSAFHLGHNVRYHPGKRMIKFPSVNTVYTVGRFGELHAIASEDVVTALYGADWNKMIDDVSEVFYSNYSFGEEVTDASNFYPASQEASVNSINDNI